MKTPETGAEVERVARGIAAEAGSRAGGDFRVDSALGAHRHRSAVIGNYDFEHAGSSRRDLLRGLDGAP